MGAISSCNNRRIVRDRSFTRDRERTYEVEELDDDHINYNLTEDQLLENIEVKLDDNPIWQIVSAVINKGSVQLLDEQEQKICEIILREFPILNVEQSDEFTVFVIIGNNHCIKMKTENEEEANNLLNIVRYQIMMSVENESMFTSKILEMTEQFHTPVDDDSDILSAPNALKKSNIDPPLLTIVILVVGTRGDVQPFIYLGQHLKRDGHRVRLATHTEYRTDVISGGLEYYPLAGDPRKLSEYMVKTGGRLIPDLLSKEERMDLPEKMKMLKEICFSCEPACTAPDPEDREQTPFIAEAIISNPVSYGHIHCAQALSIPLHIMFPQPWSPTKCYPHPLSNLGHDSFWSSKNYYSYLMVDEFMWLGLGSMINSFRRTMLRLPPIRFGEHGESLLNIWKVPISHMWSPGFVPACKDWPYYVDVVGEVRLRCIVYMYVQYISACIMLCQFLQYMHSRIIVLIYIFSFVNC